MKLNQIVNLKGYEFEPVTNKELKTLINDLDERMAEVVTEYKNSLFMTRTKALLRMQTVFKCFKSQGDNLIEKYKSSNPAEVNQFMVSIMDVQLKHTSYLIDSSLLRKAAEKAFDEEFKDLLIKTPKNKTIGQKLNLNKNDEIIKLEEEIHRVEVDLEFYENGIDMFEREGDMASYKRNVEKYKEKSKDYKKLIDKYEKMIDKQEEEKIKEITPIETTDTIKTLEREVELLNEIKRLEQELKELRENKNN